MHQRKPVTPRGASFRIVAAGVSLALSIGPGGVPPVLAAPPAAAPQVLVTITNSASMGGTTSGAIMTGSGRLAAADASLSASSSPVDYAIPPGFTPPLATNAGGLTAPYGVACATFSCDNGPSRLNIAKAAVKTMLNRYGELLYFGLYAYNTGGTKSYSTWVYHMSKAGGFTFTNVAAAGTVANPCFGYAAASLDVKTACTTLAGRYGATALGSSQYVNVAATSDDPSINDVLYTDKTDVPPVFVDFGTVSPATPFPPNKTLADYNNGTIRITYGDVLPTKGLKQTGPTNAGYVPYSPEVMYAQRGFATGASADQKSGKLLVAMGSAATAFNGTLAAESSDKSSGEMKALAGQSPIAGLLTGALSYLNGLVRQACQQQYVVLMTDGLPTLDLADKTWPPLGTVAATSYGVTASYNADGSLAATNNAALSDAITAIGNLKAAGIKTYVVGLGAGVNSASNPAAAQALQAMAMAGGTGSHFPANDAAALDAALQAIASQIQSSTAIGAAVAPPSVGSSSAQEYALTSSPSPGAGSVKAYAVGADGTVAAGTAPAWDAAEMMTTAGRTAALYSTAIDGTAKTLSQLATLEPLAFALPATPPPCVPNPGVVVAYTANPSHSYTTSSGTVCTYLAGRRPGWFLGTFSSQNMGRYLGPPAAAALLGEPGYLSYARARAGRTPMVLYTNNDGFLYATDARSGALLWGWMPRGLLAQLQNYATFQNAQYMNGGFTVVDARDAAGNWATYVVGSLQSGAEHFSLRLDGNGLPAAVVYDTVVAGGSAPGDKAGTVGTVPARQPVQVGRQPGSGVAHAVYVVSAGTASTLYEVNVATGIGTSAALGFVPSTPLQLDSQAGRLWVGSTLGDVWGGTYTGSASSDANSMLRIGSTVNPASPSTAVKPVLYAGYAEVKGVPFVYAVNASQITLFGIGPTGWTPLWAATAGGGWRYASGAYATSTTVAKFMSGAVTSDLPFVVGGTLLLPSYVPPAAGSCGYGSGYYQLYGVAGGSFPSNTITYQGAPVSSAVLAGTGAALMPTATVVRIGVGGYGVALNPATQIRDAQSGGGPEIGAPMYAPRGTGSGPIAWRQL